VDASRVFRRRGGSAPYRPGMPRNAPRGLVARCLAAAGLVVAAVLPGWMLADAVEGWIGEPLLGWMCSGGWTAAAVAVLAPHVSYRRRDAVLGAVPVLGWYVVCVLAWRAGLLPFRDWEPRPDELWRARWLPGEDNVGLWRADSRRVPVRRPVRRPARRRESLQRR
jgi:hypothetical protein